MRARKARAAGEAPVSEYLIAVDASAPSNGAPGRTRAGLEVWIAKQMDLPEMLVEAARSLADQVDRDPDRSPLWGRFLDTLRQLQEPEQRATAWSDELRRVYEVMALGQADEEWRNREHVLAVERGDPLAWGWERVVPISCVRGFHDWKQRADYWGAVRCEHCGEEQGES